MNLLPVLCMALAAAAGPAAGNPELARSRLCLGCHAIDRKLVGPAFRDVAARYAGRADIVPKLADKILRGGKDVWGPVPMPANPKLSVDEARLLAAWVLTLK